ncbi:hypothetical protein J6590_007136 [Homalodisca vitripennis]|nr:hypothetical protein J6590_101410 [Homalodisca vitripennis]KAG8303482.1 hypothetical protein J6590_007136 [Homalodisca vitripennis]
MGVGLQPLEFTDCLTDSPYFRENLHAHEKELEKTSEQIKRLVKEVKTLLNAAKPTFLEFRKSEIDTNLAIEASDQLQPVLYYQPHSWNSEIQRSIWPWLARRLQSLVHYVNATAIIRLPSDNMLMSLFIPPPPR